MPEVESPPTNTVTMRPTEIISSRGHQLLTLHNSHEDYLHADMETEDITAGLPEVPPIRVEDVDSWYNNSEDHRPALDCYKDRLPTVFNNMTLDWESAPTDLQMQWSSHNSMQQWRTARIGRLIPICRSYNLRYGPFDVDACADNEGWNAQQAKSYCAPGTAIHITPEQGLMSGAIQRGCHCRKLDHATANYLKPQGRPGPCLFYLTGQMPNGGQHWCNVAFVTV